MGLASFNYLKHYGRLKSVIEISNVEDMRTLSEEEQEIEDLIQSIESAKRKIVKEGVLYKYKVNDSLKLTGAGVVTNVKGSNNKQTFQIMSLTRKGSKAEQEQTDSELEDEIREMEKNQERFVYSSCLGGIERANVMAGYTPVTSLF
eukprot:TRINITY_DN2831_c0_g2_i1.p2 TRINITY_DN2831_c0_g2~~TRINITY_DN2831_c0_g2_i1.p2  ORF type:complete len:147 (+),score=55.18 TRINITY_DN2831_c0_g2_i1:1495-1935(+)